MNKTDAVSFAVQKQRRALAKNLPVLRAKLGLTQEHLANIINVSRQTISSIENGTREMQQCTFMALLFLFEQNAETSQLLPILNIFPTEMSAHINSLADHLPK